MWNLTVNPWVITAVEIMLVMISTGLTLHILLKKSDPKASLMWIALVWFAPMFGAIFYYVFGINRISRRAARLVDSNVQQDTAVFDELRETHEATLKSLGDRIAKLPRLEGNHIEVIKGHENVHARMIEEIESASNSIAMTTYIFRRDKLGRAVADALVRADQRGVDVKVLLDGVGNGLFRSRTFKQLRRGGVDVQRFFHSFWPWRMTFLNLRNHRKLMIVDGAMAFTGSMNIGGVKNLETQFCLRGPIVRQCLDAFQESWTTANTRHLPTDFGTYHGPTQREGGDVSARAVLSGPIYQRERLRWILLGAMGEAQSRIRIVTPYFVPDRGLLSGLILAALRGVRVEIILPEKSNYFFADWATHRQIKDLLDAGCYIYFRPDLFDHSKIMTIDGNWALFGSSNWDARSFRLNFEFDVEALDTVWVGQLDDDIDQRLEKSKIWGADDYDAQSLGRRLRNSIARLFLPYL